MIYNMMNKTKKNKKRRNGKNNKTKKEGLYNEIPKILEINGYKVLLFPSKTKVTMIECHILGGFYFENKDNTGISHLLEHALTDSWKKCKKNNCNKYWENYGISMNAHTEDLKNIYWIKGLDDIFDKMIEYIIEIVINPVFSSKVIKKEKKAIENELYQIINDPSWELYNKINENLYTREGLKYADNFKQQLKVLKELTKEKVVNYYNEYYRKNNMLFVITSNVEKKKIIQTFKKLTKKKVNKETSLLKVNNCFTYQKNIIFIPNKNAKNTDITISFPLNIKKGDYDEIYVNILSKILASDLSSILLKILRDKKNLIYGISCSSETNFCGTVILLRVSTLDKNVKKVLDIIFKTCKKYSNELIPMYNLVKFKRKQKMEILELNLNSVNTSSKFYINQLFYQMDKRTPNITTFKKFIQRVNKINRKNLKQIIKKIFDTKKCLIVYQGKKKLKNFDINSF